jgi:flagellar export protein FliJ
VRAFRFRLDQALRWRETQVNIQKARVAEASGRIVRIESALDAEARGLVEAARAAAGNRPGIDMQFYAAFRASTQSRIRKYQVEAAAARRMLNAELKRLVEANQKAEVLERLKSSSHANWQRDFDRELAAFADEAFLNRLSRQPDRRSTIQSK